MKNYCNLGGISICFQSSSVFGLIFRRCFWIRINKELFFKTTLFHIRKTSYCCDSGIIQWDNKFEIGNHNSIQFSTSISNVYTIRSIIRIFMKQLHTRIFHADTSIEKIIKTKTFHLDVSLLINLVISQGQNRVVILEALSRCNKLFMHFIFSFFSSYLNSRK